MLPTKLDVLGEMAWLAVTALVFATAWPLGIAMLACLAGSGRLQAWHIAGRQPRIPEADTLRPADIPA